VKVKVEVEVKRRYNQSSLQALAARIGVVRDSMGGIAAGCAVLSLVWAGWLCSASTQH
jgi:hypothetical protein